MSPRLEVDLNEATKLGPFEEEGTYRARVSDIDGPTKGPKSTYVTFVLEVVDGPDVNAVGRKLYENAPITGRGAGIFADRWEKLTGQELDFGEIHGVDTDELLDLEVDIYVENEEYEGEDRPQVKRWIAIR